MNTAPADSQPNQQQRVSPHPGPLTLLAATAIGGALATRMGKAPFFLAAGAAAIALLKQKKTAVPPPTPVPQSLPPPAPELDLPAYNQVEQWLSQQIIREEQAPVIEIAADAPVLPEPEDDYQPESFLLDDADETDGHGTDHEAFATLSEPVMQRAIPETEPESDPEPEPELEMAMEAPPHVIEAPAEEPPSIPVADAAWTLGVDPLPSVNEPMPYVAPAGSLYFATPMQHEAPASAKGAPFSSVFSTAPARQEEIAPPPFFASSVFQGAVFPDEISVAHAFEPLAVPPALEPASEPEPPNGPPPAEETTPEIAVELAAPGDASFDPPLAAAPPNPWQAAADVHPTPSSAVSTVTHTINAVVEAEIILRPRAPTQNSVIAKSKPAPADAGGSPNPMEVPAEPKTRPSWRSWWRGD